jgi:hypothetical protein
LTFGATFEILVGADPGDEIPPRRTIVSHVSEHGP